MRPEDFDFDLPPSFIAQKPPQQRDQSRLLVLDRASGSVEHRCFADLLEFLHPGDLIVLNNSRVIPARLNGTNARSKGEFEMLMLEENGLNDWWAMVRPGKRARVGTEIILRELGGAPANIRATVIEKNSEGHGRLQFAGVSNIQNVLDRLGEVPLPPYIHRTNPSDLEMDR